MLPVSGEPRYWKASWRKGNLQGPGLDVWLLLLSGCPSGIQDCPLRYLKLGAPDAKPETGILMQMIYEGSEGGRIWQVKKPSKDVGSAKSSLSLILQ